MTQYSCKGRISSGLGGLLLSSFPEGSLFVLLLFQAIQSQMQATFSTLLSVCQDCKWMSSYPDFYMSFEEQTQIIKLIYQSHLAHEPSFSSMENSLPESETSAGRSSSQRCLQEQAKARDICGNKLVQVFPTGADMNQQAQMKQALDRYRHRSRSSYKRDTTE